MAGLRAYLRSLDPQLPRSIWTLELGTFVNFFGSGLAFPFLLIYFHNVRGFGYGTAGLVVATLGVVGVVAGPTVGPLIDRVGGRRTLAAACSSRRSATPSCRSSTSRGRRSWRRS